MLPGRAAEAGPPWTLPGPEPQAGAEPGHARESRAFARPLPSRRGPGALPLRGRHRHHRAHHHHHQRDLPRATSTLTCSIPSKSASSMNITGNSYWRGSTAASCLSNSRSDWWLSSASGPLASPATDVCIRLGPSRSFCGRVARLPAIRLCGAGAAMAFLHWRRRGRGRSASLMTSCRALLPPWCNALMIVLSPPKCHHRLIGGGPGRCHRPPVARA